jgi:hypothetical protein
VLSEMYGGYIPLPFCVCFINQFVFSFFVLFISVRVADGKLYHPDGAWDPDTIYVTVYSKRK